MRGAMLCAGRTLALVLVTLLCLVDVAFAKGPPAKATLEGPGLSHLIEITDRRVLEMLAPGVLENWNSASSIPVVDETFPVYELVRYWSQSTHDRFRYYPNSDGTAALLYLGLYDHGGRGQYGGRWFTPSPEANEALRQLIDAPPGGIGSTTPTRAPLDLTAGLIPLAAGLLLAAAVTMGRNGKARTGAPS